jgi:hypothetical protein
LFTPPLQFVPPDENSTAEVPLVVELTNGSGYFNTSDFPEPYPTNRTAKWQIKCPKLSVAHVVFFTIDLRIGDKYILDDKVIVGKFPFTYSTKLSSGVIDMQLILNSTDISSFQGIHGAYVCIDRRWYVNWSSLPVIVLETQYSLRILKEKPSLLLEFFKRFQNYDTWLEVLQTQDTNDHIYKIISNVYKGADIPFVIPSFF